MANLQFPFQIITATFSPLDEEGNLDVSVIPNYSAFLQRNQVSGAFINGTTGESLSLTVEERLTLTEAWSCFASDDFRVIAHVGDNCVDVGQRLARQAKATGCSGIAAMAPSFFRPAGVSQLIDYLEPIAAAAGELDFYFYHMPSKTGVFLDMLEFFSVASERIPNLAGVKYTHDDLVEFGKLQAMWGERYQIYFGRDELLLPAMSLGCRGAVGTSFNYMPLTIRELAHAWSADRKEEALDLFQSAGQLIELLIEYGVLEAGKRLMSALGIECGQVRLPLRPAAPKQVEQLLQKIQRLELVDEIGQAAVSLAHSNGAGHPRKTN